MSTFFSSGEAVNLVRGPTMKPVDCAEDAIAAKKYILVYFSAHWCPHCVVFIPQLARFYDRHRESKDFEVLFVSLDTTAEAMAAYMAEMHGDWLAMTYDCAATIGMSWFRAANVQWLPRVLIYENCGDKGIRRRQLLTMDARERIVEDEDGADFPWADAPAGMQAGTEEGCESGTITTRTVVVLFITSLIVTLLILRLHQMV